MRKLLILSLFLSTLGCSSGGGGGSGSGSTDSSDDNGVRLINAAIDLAPVSLFPATSTQTVLSSSAAFALPSFYKSLPDGEQMLSVRKSYAPATVFAEQSLVANSEKKFTFLVYGDRDILGIRSAIFDDSRIELAQGQSAIRLIHALNGAAGISSVLGNAATISLDYGSASPYQALPAGDLVISVSRNADSQLVFSGIRTLQAGKHYTLLVCGEVDYLVLAPIYND